VQGFQLTFFTQQDRKHGHRPLADWLLEEARRLGVGGATLSAAAEGFGHGGRLHSAHFFDLADQPVQVTMAVDAESAQRLLARLQREDINVFYIKTAIEFGMTGERQDSESQQHK
jgi:PII-like signaling protein